MVSAGTPQPRTPSTLLSIRVPRMTPTTAPDSSSTIGPPLDPGVGSGSKSKCDSASYVPGCAIAQRMDACKTHKELTLASRPAKSR